MDLENQTDERTEDGWKTDEQEDKQRQWEVDRQTCRQAD